MCLCECTLPSICSTEWWEQSRKWWEWNPECNICSFLRGPLHIEKHNFMVQTFSLWLVIICCLNPKSEQLLKQILKPFQKLVWMEILREPHLHRWGRTSGWVQQATLAPSYPGVWDWGVCSQCDVVLCEVSGEQQGQEAKGSLSGLFQNCETTHHHTAVHKSHKFL